MIVGLMPILACAALLTVPGLQTRVEGIPRRVETWWAEQQPHDMYVPAPAEVEASGVQTAAPALTSELARQVTPSPVSAPPTQTRTQATTAPTAVAPTPTHVPTPAIAIAPAPSELKLTTFHHEYQGWNNCGPTTLAMLLSHYGYTDTQKELAPILKPNENDKNVSPSELAGYVQGHTNLGVLYRSS